MKWKILFALLSIGIVNWGVTILRKKAPQDLLKKPSVDLLPSFVENPIKLVITQKIVQDWEQAAKAAQAQQSLGANVPLFVYAISMLQLANNISIEYQAYLLPPLKQYAQIMITGHKKEFSAPEQAYHKIAKEMLAHLKSAGYDVSAIEAAFDKVPRFSQHVVSFHYRIEAKQPLPATASGVAFHI